MARDLILGKTRRSWARGFRLPPPDISDEVTLRLTETEMTMLAEVAATKARADAGDRGSRRQISRLASRVAVLEKRAARGDAEAARTLRVLRESGVFRPSQSITMGAERVSNQDYRIAVLRQAQRVAGKRRPTTLDFFRAKSAVDGTMRRAGLALFLPGSRPGRITY
jgi:hypothetical protein